MSFFRKAFHKFSNAPDGNKFGSVNAQTSTAATPSLQHDFGVALWDSTRLPENISASNFDSSRSPSSRISLAEKDDDTAPLPKFMLTTDEPRIHRTPKKPSTSSFRPFLANLAGLKLSSLDKLDDTDDSQDHVESVSLPIPDSLSSNSSTPIETLPPPLPKGQPRSKRKRRQQYFSEEAVAQSLINDTLESTSLPAAIAEQSEEVANQTTKTYDVLQEEPALSYATDDEGHSELPVDTVPTPFNASTYSLEKDSDFLPPRFPFRELPLVLPTLEQVDANGNPMLDGHLDRNLAKPDSQDENIQAPTSQEDEAEPTASNPSTQFWDAEDRRNSFGLTGDSKIPSPIIYSRATVQLEELHSLRSRLAESKARIDGLAEEKLRMMQSHRREVAQLLDTVNKLEQKETDHRMQIKSFSSENDRLKAERDDIVQQLKFQIEENENLEKANQELQRDSLAFRDFRAKIRHDEIEYARLFKERDSWQGQIDDMHQRLSDAERRVRCLDVISRQKYEAKLDGAYGSGSAVGRSIKLHFSPHVKGPSMDVISAVTVFNEEVLQTASYIVEHLDEVRSNATHVMSKEVARGKEIWGSKVVTMLQKQAQNSSQLNFLLLQNCLEVFMTHWCVQIVEGWYPKQPSFSDILVELTAQSASVNGSGNL